MYISYITSEAYSPYCGISLTSLLVNNKNLVHLEIFIVTYDMTDETKDLFIRLAEMYNRKITFIDAMPIIQDLRENYRIKDFSGTPIGYTRIFPNRLYPDNVERVLYIDSDTIIINELSEIEHLDMGEYAFAMAENLSFEFSPHLLMENEKRAFDLKGKNFNSGVILCDRNNYIRNGIENIIIEELKKEDTYAYAEQSIINCGIPFKYIKRLPLKYNYYLHRFSRYEIVDVINAYSKIYDINDLIDAENNPVIVHYVGDRSRPWYREAVTRRKKEFQKYKEMSLWRDLKLQTIFKTKYYSNLPTVNKIAQVVSIPLFNTKLLYFYHKYRDRNLYYT